MNDKEARTPILIEKNGIKFSFLCYNAITGGLSADSDSGTAFLEIEPWYRDKEVSIQKLEADIKNAKKVSDVVIVSPHWGVEYKLIPNLSQQKVAKRAIEAGADLILGTHPHVVQGSEIYNGKYITYSLGNLIFDQEWSEETKQGTVLENYFYDKNQVAANLKPLVIKNYHQPEFVIGEIANSIISRIKTASKGL
jgi:poly-gamma-glutamate synthesis protein (capsule biosynthesis protein)